MSVYVFGHSGYDSHAWLVEAESEDEAMGKIVNQEGYSPVGEILGTVEEVMEDGEVNRIA